MGIQLNAGNYVGLLYSRDRKQLGIQVIYLVKFLVDESDVSLAVFHKYQNAICLLHDTLKLRLQSPNANEYNMTMK